MIIDCDRCPGRDILPPACPSCSLRTVLQAPRPRPVDLGPHRPPEQRLTDDRGELLDAAELRAVAILTGHGLLAPPGQRGRRSA